MSPFIETVLGGVALATISALTFVAYKHPKSYAKLHGPLMAGLATIFLCWSMFLYGKSLGWNEANESARVLNEGVVKTGFCEYPTLWQYMFWPIAFAYLIFLSFFPKLFNDSDNDKEDSPKATGDTESP